MHIANRAQLSRFWMFRKQVNYYYKLTTKFGGIPDMQNCLIVNTMFEHEHYFYKNFKNVTTLIIRPKMLDSMCFLEDFINVRTLVIQGPFWHSTFESNHKYFKNLECLAINGWLI
jgi:hypothetical protein